MEKIASEVNDRREENLHTERSLIEKDIEDPEQISASDSIFEMAESLDQNASLASRVGEPELKTPLDSRD